MSNGIAGCVTHGSRSAELTVALCQRRTHSDVLHEQVLRDHTSWVMTELAFHVNAEEPIIGDRVRPIISS